MVALIALLHGCAPLEPPSMSPLLPPQMSSDSVALDIIFVQVPDTEQELVSQVWDEVDEQVVDPSVRELLAQNGFRCGLTGTQLPRSFERLIESELGSGDKADPTVVEDLEPKALHCRQRHLQLRGGKRSEVIVSGVQDSWPMLVRDGSEVSGRTFQQAQGILALVVHPRGDGRADCEVVPELHHGSPRRQYVASEGSWLLDSGRPREVFDRMKIAATLSPGEMLLVGSVPNMPGSLGQRFFAMGDGSSVATPGERLLLIRLAQTQRDNRFEAEQTDGSGTWADELSAAAE